MAFESIEKPRVIDPLSYGLRHTTLDRSAIERNQPLASIEKTLPRAVESPGFKGVGLKVNHLCDDFHHLKFVTHSGHQQQGRIEPTASGI